MTGRGCASLAAVLTLATGGFDFVVVGSDGGNGVAESLSEKQIAVLGKVGMEPDFLCESCSSAEVGSLHQLKILLVLCCGTGGDFIDPLGHMTLVSAAKFSEGVEEVVVT